MGLIYQFADAVLARTSGDGGIHYATFSHMQAVRYLIIKMMAEHSTPRFSYTGRVKIDRPLSMHFDTEITPRAPFYTAIITPQRKMRRLIGDTAAMGDGAYGRSRC